MEAGQQRWQQLINRIDRVGIERQRELLARQTLRKKHYVDLIREECHDKFIKKQQQSQQKYSERALIDNGVRVDAERHQDQKKQRQQKQKRYGQDNLSLMRHRRNKTLANIQVPQHPFIKLVDEDQKRQYAYRQDLKKQNQANLMQQDIKRQQEQLQKLVARQQRHMYQNHVQQYFRNRQDKLRRQRIRHLYNDHTQSNTSDQIDEIQKKLQKRYLEELKKTIKQKRRLKTDNTMSLFEESVNNPEITSSASPALLGRVPIAHDRMRQLDILDRQLGLRKQQVDATILRRPSQLPQIDIFAMEMRQLERKRQSSRLSRYEAQKRVKQPQQSADKQSPLKLNSVDQPNTRRIQQPIQTHVINVPDPQTPQKPTPIRRTIKTYNFLTNQPQLYNI